MKAFNARSRQSILKRKFIKGAVKLVRGDSGGTLKRKKLCIYIKRLNIDKKLSYCIQAQLCDDWHVMINEKEEVLLRKEIKRIFKSTLRGIFDYKEWNRKVGI